MTWRQQAKLPSTRTIAACSFDSLKCTIVSVNSRASRPMKMLCNTVQPWNVFDPFPLPLQDAAAAVAVRSYTFDDRKMREPRTKLRNGRRRTATIPLDWFCPNHILLWTSRHGKLGKIGHAPIVEHNNGRCMGLLDTGRVLDDSYSRLFAFARALSSKTVIVLRTLRSTRLQHGAMSCRGEVSTLYCNVHTGRGVKSCFRDLERHLWTTLAWSLCKTPL